MERKIGANIAISLLLVASIVISVFFALFLTIMGTAAPTMTEGGRAMIITIVAVIMGVSILVGIIGVIRSFIRRQYKAGTFFAMCPLVPLVLLLVIGTLWELTIGIIGW